MESRLQYYQVSERLFYFSGASVCGQNDLSLPSGFVFYFPGKKNASILLLVKTKAALLRSAKLDDRADQGLTKLRPMSRLDYTSISKIKFTSLKGISVEVRGWN